jgi:hypothetical protein
MHATHSECFEVDQGAMAVSLFARSWLVSSGHGREQQIQLTGHGLHSQRETGAARCQGESMIGAKPPTS